MIEFKNGDLLADDAVALVNTVNCVGVMGKGIALAFKGAFAANYLEYRAACGDREISPGGIFVTDTGSMFGARYIVNVATKDHWRDPSKLEWIIQGAKAIAEFCDEQKIETIAVPALGCSNGGLSWSTVGPILEAAFEGKATTFRIYRPQ